jgi:hypothetical protein
MVVRRGTTELAERIGLMLMTVITNVRRPISKLRSPHRRRQNSDGMASHLFEASVSVVRP